MSNIEIGTLYDINKNIVTTQKELSNTELRKSLREIKYFFLKNSNKYFMLLCRERYDFTLFNIKNKEEFNLQKAVQELKECLFNRGKIISIDLTNDMETFEIWIKLNENTSYVYYLFPYDRGVIEV